MRRIKAEIIPIPWIPVVDVTSIITTDSSVAVDDNSASVILFCCIRQTRKPHTENIKTHRIRVDEYGARVSRAC